MALLTSLTKIARELWWALDTSSALKLGQPMSENARKYCTVAPDAPSARTAPAEETIPETASESSDELAAEPVEATADENGPLAAA